MLSRCCWLVESIQPLLDCHTLRMPEYVMLLKRFSMFFSSIRFWLLLNSISVMKRLLCSRRTDERDTRESMDLEEM